MLRKFFQAAIVVEKHKILFSNTTGFFQHFYIILFLNASIMYTIFKKRFINQNASFFSYIKYTFFISILLKLFRSST
jgi:hypothetical protein